MPKKIGQQRKQLEPANFFSSLRTPRTLVIIMRKKILEFWSKSIFDFFFSKLILYHASRATRKTMPCDAGHFIVRNVTSF